jgi:hypothetical protein
VPQPAQARRREGWFSNRFVMKRAAFPIGINLGFTSKRVILRGQYTPAKHPREIRWPAIRKQPLLRSIASD